eukprot:12582753-Ditylum_brightwellii.AAC.1
MHNTTLKLRQGSLKSIINPHMIALPLMKVKTRVPPSNWLFQVSTLLMALQSVHWCETIQCVQNKEGRKSG